MDQADYNGNWLAALAGGKSEPVNVTMALVKLYYKDNSTSLQDFLKIEGKNGAKSFWMRSMDDLTYRGEDCPNCTNYMYIGSFYWAATTLTDNGFPTNTTPPLPSISIARQYHRNGDIEEIDLSAGNDGLAQEAFFENLASFEYFGVQKEAGTATYQADTGSYKRYGNTVSYRGVLNPPAPIPTPQPTPTVDPYSFTISGQFQVNKEIPMPIGGRTLKVIDVTNDSSGNQLVRLQLLDSTHVIDDFTLKKGGVYANNGIEVYAADVFDLGQFIEQYQSRGLYVGDRSEFAAGFSFAQLEIRQIDQAHPASTPQPTAITEPDLAATPTIPQSPPSFTLQINQDLQIGGGDIRFVGVTLEDSAQGKIPVAHYLVFGYGGSFSTTAKNGGTAWFENSMLTFQNIVSAGPSSTLEITVDAPPGTNVNAIVPSSSPTPQATATPSPTPAPTPTPTATPTPTNTPSPTATATASPTDTPTPTPTSSPTATPSPSPTPTSTPTPTATASSTPTPTSTPTAAGGGAGGASSDGRVYTAQ